MASRCRKNRRLSINNAVFVSDTHCGCRMGLCPTGPVSLDDGGTYSPSRVQRQVWLLWEEFWKDWVPRSTHGEPFWAVMNGDSLDGVHHGSTTQISQNLSDQAAIAKLCMKPMIDACEGRLLWVRGTEAHVGKSGAEEERLARSCGAVPSRDGQYAQHTIWLKVGGGLVNISHHIGSTSSQGYEATAPTVELVGAYAEAGRWGLRPPDVVVRSHRHRNIEVRWPARNGYGGVFCTAGWQLKTPFSHRIAGARLSEPQIGGSLIRQGDEEFHTRHKVWVMRRPLVITESVLTAFKEVPR